ncbi:restriction system modified-DNA reader domain-containing protein [Streptomyces pactum]|uniref:restriction system modified-DNA reader domain-containing protein n=1 Tax=Streptomyces pactum TaxID=68249 RepID=UPI0037014BD4
MGKRMIEVDEEVFAFLRRHCRPPVDTPNDVLRRMLLDEGARASAPPVRRAGELKQLIDDGLIAPGDTLRYHEPRRGRTHEATVAADGWIEVPGSGSFPKPSSALKAQTGIDADGWAKYTHVPGGRLLEELREDLRRRT